MSGDRIRGAVAGLAVGDAVGWPAARHRAALHAPWSRRLHRELDAFAEEHQVTTLPVPFALNQPVAPLRIGPSDDAEWLAWTLLTIDRPRAEAFRDLVPSRPGAGPSGEAPAPIRARISVATALDNLADGVEPPASGHDNPHHFDDAAAIRAVAFGVLGRDPTEDAQVTNAGDGVLAAQAMAAAVAAGSMSGDVAAAVEAALDMLPADTAIGHNARLALSVARKAGDPFAAVPALDAALLDHVYSYGVGAAQTVPVALALAEAAGGELTRAVPAAACLARLADSAPALTGALTGACGGYGAIPEGWTAPARTLAGCCLPDLAGRDLIELLEGIA
ncbi:ADP-ribosylglycohydrolase family protein [Nonomuraea fuscirosea]|uniref:ADP-ribosylglycohydrolase family protein n=1 Tax=Nonomuraea fuscirosea TaxID=1291556 RepID=UPI002DDABA0A|nr:ADP-ribosylglycohydrolase family protein [Nonomuraea fuscirosea]WSA55101.1 ADP-ribosylglycohydrolase family protein [Nonomuraea fuscirosea]